MQCVTQQQSVVVIGNPKRCCIAYQGNKFYRHLSINRHLTSADLPKSLDICEVDGSNGNEFI